HFILTDLRTGEKEADVRTGPHRLNTLAWLPGPEPTLLIAGEEGRIAAWSPAKREFLREEASHSGKVAAMAWLPGGELATAAAGPDVRVWPLATGKCRSLPSGLHACVAALAACEEGLLVGGAGPAVYLLDPATGRKLGEFPLEDCVFTLCPLP